LLEVTGPFTYLAFLGLSGEGVVNLTRRCNARILRFKTDDRFTYAAGWPRSSDGRNSDRYGSLLMFLRQQDSITSPRTPKTA
jgi:hypothetical protein